MNTLKTNKLIALILGIILLTFYVYNRIIPIHVNTYDQIVAGRITNVVGNIIMRIISAILCVNIAKSLNRDQTLWAIFGIILPPIALIVVYFLRPSKSKENISENMTVDKIKEAEIVTQTMNFDLLTEEEQKEAKKFIDFGIKPNQKLIINKISRKIERVDPDEWAEIAQKSEISKWIILKYDLKKL